MSGFLTRSLSATADAIAPDGSEVRLLATSSRGSMAHFQLPPGAISKAVAHHTVSELWFIVAGNGRMWRAAPNGESIVDLVPGVSLAIEPGTKFQFRNDGEEAFQAVGVTMPPWPGMDEAYEVKGIW